jgi:hypothetical protein
MANLSFLSLKYKTDKGAEHNYVKIYEKYMKISQNKTVSLFEIGVGGYNSPNEGGNSLRMWQSYFKKGMIYAIDIYEKSLLQTDRIKIFKGSQTDKNFLNKIFSKIGKVNFIIDDGSHQNNDIIQTFELIFKYLKKGGYYFIEDIQTSYWPRYQGNSFDLNVSQNAINYFKKIVDKINYMELDNPFIKHDYFSKNITEIHFYHNLIVIKKSDNNEKSNILINNRLPIKKKNYLKFRNFFRLSKYYFYYLKSIYNKFVEFFKFK